MMMATCCGGTGDFSGEFTSHQAYNAAPALAKAKKETFGHLSIKFLALTRKQNKTVRDQKRYLNKITKIGLPIRDAPSPPASK